MVWRTCRFGVARNATYSQMNFNKCVFACHVGFKNRVVTIGLGHIYTQLDLLQGARVHEITPFQLVHIFPMFLLWFHVNVLCCFSKVHKIRANRSQLDTLHGARVHEASLCVTYAASRFGTNFRALTQRSKYVMCSVAFGAPAFQTTVCVASGPRLVCFVWSARFQDVVSLCNTVGGWVWVGQQALYKKAPPQRGR